MKKQILKSSLIAVAGIGLFVGSAMALPAEWELVNPSSIQGTGSLLNTAGYDFGYYIWTDDAERISWHIRWEDNVASGITIFSGDIGLENATGLFTTFSFEANDTFVVVNPEAVTWISKITTGVDGIDFTIAQTASPSFVGFDLKYQGKQLDGSTVYLGDSGETVKDLGQDGDFSIAAPIPEPTTMLLFGSGILGLAGLARRRKANQAR